MFNIRSKLKISILHFILTVNTHIHAGHVTGTGTLKKYFPQCKSVLSEHSGAKADVYVDQDDELTFGKQVRQSKSYVLKFNPVQIYDANL